MDKLRERKSNAINVSNLNASIERIRAAQERRLKKLTLFRRPISTLLCFVLYCRAYAWACIEYFGQHRTLSLSILGSLLAAVLLYVTPGPHQLYVQSFEEFALIMSWWVFLGILSSVGLGTGLHTFVLYLGPYIASVAMTASECGTLDFETHGDNSFVCPEYSGEIASDPITMPQILLKVWLEALMWGAGTAIGELPPYLVARAARLSGKASQELEEFEQENNTFIHRMKKQALSFLPRLGFFGIMLFASIPNPLFDLAGITCGHLLIPFRTFFLATLAGKAVIKATLQAVFVITLFDLKKITYLIEALEALVPPLQGKLHDLLEKERRKLHRLPGTPIQETATASSWLSLSFLWNMVIFTMIAYFLVSIINACAQEYQAQKNEEELQKIRNLQNIYRKE
mmetsp:Transcript_52528/g.132121  ORF Transcript_52528/g.132121 Transcript_52528/m.132121 type:complete len:400 (+) Transcript_52528:71-1270(+)|eukprot:CAMPEP_0177653950 /NCGR_PEP_ID=MMETSP0447-20121125/14029_1 /TAXON_ID=0 /ORGANISM="Stygamoeba regulata, Strain BSH-02190019" /LENGTH=399 /DNA_ID=CAMNT_0019157481 /DNA_START=66 /DNA_END=1265 /DNA_ORIENTATION=+